MISLCSGTERECKGLSQSFQPAADLQSKKGLQDKEVQQAIRPFIKTSEQPGEVMHACNSSTGEMEV
jgi:hypothetical protein